MKFMTKAVLVCFALPRSSMAVAAACSSEQKAANEVNALILVDQTPPFVVPKSIDMQIESKDGFMHEKVPLRLTIVEGFFRPTLFRKEMKKHPKVS